jgi:hypothetical protein
MTIRFDRLQDCITALRHPPASARFCMYHVYNDSGCKSPACVMGHYDFMFRDRALLSGEQMGAVHFSLTDYQVEELFGARGCDNAETPEQAIAYIEKFIARHGGDTLDPAYTALRDSLKSEMKEPSHATV